MVVGDITFDRNLYFEIQQRCASVSYRLWRFDEHFGLAQLELVLVHVHRVEEVEDSLPLLSPPTRPGFLC